MSEKQKNILLDILSVLDHYSQQKSQNTHNLQQAKLKALIWIDKAIETQERNVFIQVLEYLNSIKHKSDGFQVTYLTNMNHAFMIQEQWKNTEQENVLKNSHLIKNAIRSLKLCIKQNQKSNEIELLNKIKYLYTLVKNYLQLAASLSQEQNNKTAYKNCVKSMKVFLKLVKNLKYLLKKQKSNNSSLNDLMDNTKQIFMQKFWDFLDYIEKLFREILHFIIIEDYGSDTEQFFQINENHQKFLQNQQKIKVEWLSKITIQNFMHLEYYSLQKIQHQIQQSEIFTEGFLSLIIILSSTILFCLSTEKRINTYKNLHDNDTSHFKIQPLFEQTQEQKIRKIPQFKFAERMHYLSLKLIESYFEKTQFYNHLQESYQEHFNQRLELQPIPEEESQLFSKCSKVFDFMGSAFEYSMEKSTVLENSTAITNQYKNERYLAIQEKISELQQSYVLTQSQDINDIQNLLENRIEDMYELEKKQVQKNNMKKNKPRKNQTIKSQKLKINKNKVNINSQKSLKGFASQCKLFNRKIQAENRKLIEKKIREQSKSGQQKSEQNIQNTSKKNLNRCSLSIKKQNSRNQSKIRDSKIDIFKKKFFSNQNYIDQLQKSQGNHNLKNTETKQKKQKDRLRTSLNRLKSCKKQKILKALQNKQTLLNQLKQIQNKMQQYIKNFYLQKTESCLKFYSKFICQKSFTIYLLFLLVFFFILIFIQNRCLIFSNHTLRLQFQLTIVLHKLFYQQNVSLLDMLFFII